MESLDGDGQLHAKVLHVDGVLLKPVRPHLDGMPCTQKGVEGFVDNIVGRRARAFGAELGAATQIRLRALQQSSARAPDF